MDKFDQVLDLFNCTFDKTRGGKTYVRQNRAFNRAWALTELFMLQDLLVKREPMPNRAPEDEHTPMTREEIETTLDELVAHGAVKFDGSAYRLAGWTDPAGYRPESWKRRTARDDEDPSCPERTYALMFAGEYRRAT